MRNLYKSILIVVVAIFSLESVATAQILKNLLKQTTTAATASTPTAYSQGQTAGTIENASQIASKVTDILSLFK